MKIIKWIFAVIVLVSIWEIIIAYRQKITFVIDDEHDFTNQQITRIDSLYKQHQDKTTNQMILATTADFGFDTSINEFSLHFLRNHRIGKKEVNNGILIVFSEHKREVRIETGYGTEKVLKDEICKKIIDSLMIPEFKKQKYFDGIWKGSIAIVNFLERPENKIK